MNPLIWVVGMTAAAGIGGTGLGGLAGALFQKKAERTVPLLLGFAGGVMLSVVCFDLISGALRASGTEAAGVWTVIAGLLAGYGAILLLNGCIDRHMGRRRSAESLPAGGQSGRRFRLLVGGVVLAAAIALHNFPEGMVIGAAYAAEKTAAVSGSGFLMAVVIGLHNVPEGMAVAVPMISGGMGRGRAVLVTALAGAPTVIGAVFGYLLGTVSQRMLALSLSFASGAMLYVVFGELLPEAFAMRREKRTALSLLAGMAVGLLIIYG